MRYLFQTLSTYSINIKIGNTLVASSSSMKNTLARRGRRGVGNTKFKLNRIPAAAS